MHTLKVYSGFIIILVASFLLCSMKDPFRNQNDILLFQNLRNDSILIDTSEQSLNNFFKEVYFPELLDGYSSYFIQCVKRNNNGFWQILIGGRKSDGSFKTQFNLWGNDSSIEDETYYAVKSNSGDCIAYFVIDWNAIPNDYCFYWEDNPNGNFSECCYQLQGNSVISHNIAPKGTTTTLPKMNNIDKNLFRGIDNDTITDFVSQLDELRNRSSNTNMGNEALSVIYNLQKLASEKKFAYGFYQETATAQAGNYEMKHGIPLPKKTDKASINSTIYKLIGRYPIIYGTDLDLITGNWLKSPNREKEIASLISTIRKMYKENGAIPAFSWHLENPYIVSDHNFYNAKYDGATYISNRHPNVVAEILNNTGDLCGFGNYTGTDDINTFCNPRAWLLSLLDDVVVILNQLELEGVNIPVIIRPLHECNTGAFWWGKGHCSNGEYIELYRLIVDYIKKHCTNNNLLYCYNTDIFINKTDLLSRYPSDEYVDIVSYDCYSTKSLDFNLLLARIVTAIAEEHGKISAIYEIGSNANTLEGESRDIYTQWYNILSAENVRIGLIMSWSHRLTYNEHIKDYYKQFLKKKNLIKAGDVELTTINPN